MPDFNAIYNEIRDIPYQLGMAPDDHAPNCLNKGLMLVEKLALYGIAARGRIGEFDWATTPFPPEVTRLWPQDIPATHFFVEVWRDNQWRPLDPSWDAALAKAGFPISDWNGTHCPGVSLQRVYSLEEHAAYLDAWEDPARIADFFHRAGPFLKAGEAWLSSIR